MTPPSVSLQRSGSVPADLNPLPGSVDVAAPMHRKFVLVRTYALYSTYFAPALNTDGAHTSSCCAHAGSSLLAIALPTLAQLTRSGDLITWTSPRSPSVPYAYQTPATFSTNGSGKSSGPMMRGVLYGGLPTAVAAGPITTTAAATLTARRETRSRRTMGRGYDGVAGFGWTAGTVKPCSTAAGRPTSSGD